MTSLALEIPSPTVAVWQLGPLPIRAYAMCILAGIVVALWITNKRLIARGHRPGVAFDIASWAVPFGIVGGRIYHVITSPQAYFGEGGDPVRAFFIWEGGLGIWGALALGVVGSIIGARRAGVPAVDFLDAVAPAWLVSQAIGRLGNYFNNELYGGPTSLPWGLRVHEWDQSAGRAVLDAAGNPVVIGVVHPTFLYELVFCLVLAAVILRWERRRHPAPGQVFAAAIMGYPVGRIVVEFMRTDEANRILGLRLNVWTCLIVFALGVWLFRRAGERARASHHVDPPSQSVI